MGKNISILIHDFNLKKREIKESDRLIIICIKRTILYSSSNNIPSLDIKFRITNVYPLSGSVMGGTRVTITGEGFSTNTTGTKVKVGQYDCAIESVSTTQIVCLIQDTATIHKVDNQGVHPRKFVFFILKSISVNCNYANVW